MKQHYQGLGHIAVYTADMDASIAFYEKIGGSLHLRAPACSPEQQRELALVEFGGFLVELIAAPVPEGAGLLCAMSEQGLQNWDWHRRESNHS